MRIRLGEFFKNHFDWETWEYPVSRAGDWYEYEKGHYLLVPVTLRDVVEDPRVVLLEDGGEWVKVEYGGKRYTVFEEDDIALFCKFAGQCYKPVLLVRVEG